MRVKATCKIGSLGFAFELLLFLPLITAAAPKFTGEWRCTALTPCHLALTGDYTQAEQKLFHKHFSIWRYLMRDRRISPWVDELRFRFSTAETFSEIRPELVRMLRDHPAIKISSAAGTRYFTAQSS